MIANEETPPPRDPHALSEEIETSTPSVIHRIVRGALAQPLLTTILAVALVGAGIWSFLRLPVDAYPDLVADIEYKPAGRSRNTNAPLPSLTTLSGNRLKVAGAAPGTGG